MSYIWANEFTDSIIATIKERVTTTLKENDKVVNKAREDKICRVMLARLGTKLANDICDEYFGKEEE